MAEFLIPGGGTLSEDTTSAEYLLPGGGTISVEVAVPPTGAIMNQLQGPNLGADLFNGTLIT